MPAQMQTVAQVEFYWPGYDPRKAIDFFEQTPIENVTLRQGAADRDRGKRPKPLTSGCASRAAAIATETDRSAPAWTMGRLSTVAPTFATNIREERPR